MRSNSDEVPRCNSAENGPIGHARFLEFAFEQRQRQTRTIHDRNINLFQVKRNAADVIFMAVGDNHPLDFVLVFTQIGHVRQHNINAVHSITREGQTRIQQHNFVAVFKHAGVFADFVQSAEGNDF